ncbi:hypothetical protein [Rickettsia rhipicephali]|nr:hypothetical protein [Rickettsia rhipicephali]
MPNLDIKILNQVKKIIQQILLVTKSLVKIVNTTPNYSTQGI